MSWVSACDDGLEFGLRESDSLEAEPSESVREFMAKFDNGEPVEPFSFTAEFE